MKKLLQAGVALGAGLMLCACAMRTAYRQPEIEVAGSYGAGDSIRNAPASTLVSTAEVPDVPRDRWWQQFGDDRLDRLVTQVLEVNQDLAAAGLRVQRAQLAAGLTGTARYPLVEASVGSSYSKELGHGTQGVRGNSVNATVSYQVDLWGRLAAQRDAAKWEALATTQDRDGIRLALVGQACDVFWTLGFYNQRVRSGEDSLARLARTLALVRSQFESGAVSRLEVREAEQNLQAQQVALSQLVQQRVETRNMLALLLDGRPWPQAVEPQDLGNALALSVEAGIPAQLLGRRPDLRAAELRLRASVNDIDGVRASYYPAISLTGSVGSSSSALAQVLRNPVGTLGAGLTLPFLNRNEMRLSIAIARTDYAIAVSNFRTALYSAFVDVDNALSARAQLAVQLRSAQAAFEAAAEIERLYEVRYRSGATALRLWLDAQEARRNAELSLADTRLNQLRNDAVLLQALGGSSG